MIYTQVMKTKDSIKKHSLQPTVILVEPQMGENIGAAARAMWNFGLERLRIVNPRDGWPNQKAVVMASGAGRLLDEASIYNTTNESIADLTYVFATTARVRGLNKNVITPLQAMKKTRNLIESGERVGVLFGPERAGLSNDDTALAISWTSGAMAIAVSHSAAGASAATANALSVGTSVGGFAVEVTAASHSTAAYDSLGMSASMPVDGLGTVTFITGSNDTDAKSSYAVGFAKALGGGATLSGYYGSVNGNDVADLGIGFSF